jgi:hypothetical protein
MKYKPDNVSLNFVAGDVMKVVLKKYVTASPIPVDILIWPLRCLQVVQDPN